MLTLIPDPPSPPHCARIGGWGGDAVRVRLNGDRILLDATDGRTQAPVLLTAAQAYALTAVLGDLICQLGFLPGAVRQPRQSAPL